MAHFHKKHALDAIATINVTSLIDLGFSLLIVFMITTPLIEHEQSIPLSLPVEAASTQEHPDDPIQGISIDAAGRYFWGKEVVSKADLERHISQNTRLRSQPIYHLRAEANLPYQKVIDVLELLKKYNQTKISFDTQIR